MAVGRKDLLQCSFKTRSHLSPGVQVSWATATLWTTPPSWCQSFASAPNRAKPWRPTSSAGGWTSGRLERPWKRHSHHCVCTRGPNSKSNSNSVSFRFTRLSFGGTLEQKENDGTLLQPFPFHKRPLNITLPFCFLLLCPRLSPTGLDGVEED